MRILGHRGARREAPENTLAGIERALAAGADGVEVDVRRTADGRLVVIHDATVARTTDGRGSVARMSFDTLRGLDAGDGERVPSLEEVVLAVRGRGELFVEVKDPGCAVDAARLVARTGDVRECLVKCFDHRPLAAVRAAAPGLRTGCLLVGRPADPVTLARVAGADVLSLDHAWLDADLVDACHSAGVAVCAWTCNAPRAARRLRSIGVDWLVTDVPSRLVPVLRDRV